MKELSTYNRVAGYLNRLFDLGNTYHNHRFRDCAEAHGLIVEHHPQYGWTITHPSDRLLQFCLDNDLGDILINRNEYSGYRVTGTSTHAPAPPSTTAKKHSVRKYVCPCCGNSVRATKNVNIGCLDCAEQMVLAG